MADARGRSPLSVLIALAVVGTALAFAWAGLELVTHRILQVFSGAYLRARATALLLAFLASGYLAAVLVYAGLSAARPAGAAADSRRTADGRAARRVLRLSVAASCLYALLAVTVEPQVVRRYETIRRQSAEARSHEEAARHAMEQGDPALARAHIQAYLLIDPLNGYWRHALSELEARLSTDEDGAAASALSQSPSLPPSHPEGASAGELLRTAESHLAREDYPTAYVFALRAQALAPGDPTALAIRQAAADAMARTGPGQVEKTRTALYQVKQTAGKLLQDGDAVSAYYLLKRALARYGADRELEEFLDRAERAVEREAFFTDTIPKPSATPTHDLARRVAFINRRASGAEEIVYADSVVRTPRTVTERRQRPDGSLEITKRDVVDVYMYDVEILAFGGGRLLYHVLAPVGRLLPPPTEPQGEQPQPPERFLIAARPAGAQPVAWITLLALGRENDLERLAPRFLAGTPQTFSRFALAAQQPAASHLLPLVVPVPTVWELGLEAGRMRERTLTELWSLWRALGSPAAALELALRAARPFVLLLLAAAAATFGRRHAPLAPRRPSVYLLTPALAAVAHMAFVLTLHICRVALVFGVPTFGWIPSLAVAAGTLAALLVVQLFRMERSLRNA